MTHYEARLEADLAAVRKRVADVAAAVEKAIEQSVHSLLRGDRDLAARTILGDHPINRATREIDRLCHLFVARHLPSAGHLRYVSSVLRLMVAVERIGDYAVTIARESVQLSEPPPATVSRDIELMADQAVRMFSQAMTAFNKGNAELARGAKGLAGHSKLTFSKVFADLLKEGEQQSRPVRDLFALLIVLYRLERVGDQAKNICEETIFAATGETKAPKVYQVLFLDASNARASLMAENIARKAFPESGEYASAGWAPGSEVVPAVAAFLERHGHDLGGRAPRQLVAAREALNDYHVLVSLDGDPTAHFPEGVPFHTVLLQWDVAGGDDDESLEALYKDLSGRVRQLMETLRGEQAS